MINIIKIIKETDSLEKAGYVIEIEVIIGIIRSSEAGTSLEMTGIEINIIEVIKETLKIETVVI